MVGIRLFPLGAFRPIFRGKMAVSFREGINSVPRGCNSSGYDDEAQGTVESLSVCWGAQSKSQRFREPMEDVASGK